MRGQSMGFYGHAEAAAQKIVRAFADPNSLPKPLAQIFIRRKDSLHCRKWSWGNQLLMLLNRFTDARTFKQWQEVGRSVKKGEKAFYILGPIPKTVLDKETGEERKIVVGFKGIPVFGLEQTAGEPLPTSDPDIENWVNSLPLLESAAMLCKRLGCHRNTGGVQERNLHRRDGGSEWIGPGARLDRARRRNR